MTPIFPTAYFGSISYYKSLFSFSSILIEGNENYIKQSLRNRCDIATSNGILQLSIPVKKINGSKTKTKDIQISNDTNWQKNHWKAIESVYSSSPYFDHYETEIKELIFNDEVNLIKFNNLIHNSIAQWLGIKTEVSFTSEFIHNLNEEIDFRNQFDKKNHIDKDSFKTYHQVFENEIGFIPNLSILDAIFALGPMARNLIN